MVWRILACIHRLDIVNRSCASFRWAEYEGCFSNLAMPYSSSQLRQDKRDCASFRWAEYEGCFSNLAMPYSSSQLRQDKREKRQHSAQRLRYVVVSWLLTPHSYLLTLTVTTVSVNMIRLLQKSPSITEALPCRVLMQIDFARPLPCHLEEGSIWLRSPFSQPDFMQLLIQEFFRRPRSSATEPRHRC